MTTYAFQIDGNHNWDLYYGRHYNEHWLQRATDEQEWHFSGAGVLSRPGFSEHPGI
jgi:hypothetical protein